MISYLKFQADLTRLIISSIIRTLVRIVFKFMFVRTLGKSRQALSPLNFSELLLREPGKPHFGDTVQVFYK